MAHAVGDMLPFAVALAIGPIPNIVVMLLLTTPHGRVNGLAFLAGWIAGLYVTGLVVLAIVDPVGPGEISDPSPWVSWLRLAVGILLLAYAIKSWQKRPGPNDPVELPKWMGALDDISAQRAALVGLGLGSINPKSLAFVVLAITAIAVADHAVDDQLIALAIFVVVGSLGVIGPIALAAGLGSRGENVLAAMKSWMIKNNKAVMSGVFLVLGAKLLGDALGGLFG